MGIDIKEALKILQEYPTEDRYWIAKVVRFQNSNGDPDDNSIDLSHYWNDCVRTIVEYVQKFIEQESQPRKSAEEIIRHTPGHTYPTGHILSGINFYDEKTVIRAMKEYAGQFQYDYSKSCQCPEEDRIGETWCCNTCGLPVRKVGQFQGKELREELDIYDNENLSVLREELLRFKIWENIFIDKMDDEPLPTVEYILNQYFEYLKSR